MVAPNYSEQRSKLAPESGLGRPLGEPAPTIDAVEPQPTEGSPASSDTADQETA